MNKYNYYSTASKFLFAGTILLLITKVCQLTALVIPSISVTMNLLSAKINDISFYGFLILSFLAFNGESVFYKKNKEYKKRKITVNLRRLVVFNFFMVFFKNAFTSSAMSKPLTTVGGLLIRFFIALLLDVSTLSFVLFCAVIWYTVRDNENKKLFSFQIVSLVICIIYFFVKYLNNTVDFGINILGDTFNNIVSNDIFVNSLCVVQYIAELATFFVMTRYFSNIADKTDEENKTKKVRNSNSLYEDKGFGIDNFDLLLNKDTIIDE